MTEMVALPISEKDLATAKILLSEVANDPEHEEEMFCEVEFLNDVWLTVAATWDEELEESFFEVYDQSDRSDAWWFDLKDIERNRYVDVGGDRVIRFCRV